MKQINIISPSFKEKNLTAFAGLNPIFQYLVYNLNIFELLDRQVTFKKKKKNFTKQDYFKILFVFFLIGYERLKHILLLAQDQFVLKLLNLTRIVMPENIVRCFLVKFNFKHTYEVGQVNGNLLKKKHQKLFPKVTDGYDIVDCDSTPRDTHGHQEATGKHYKNHNGYHPIMAFIYQTKEFLHGYLRPGATYTGNGIVEFLKESLMRLPYYIKTILFRADSGNSENYIKEIKQDLNLEKTTFDKFWHNEAFFQIMMLVYNCIIWFKAEFISIKEAVHERIYTFRFKYLFIPAKLKTRSRYFYLDMPRDFNFKSIFENVFLKTVRLRV